MSKWDIDQWVEEKALLPRFSFYPSLPAKQLKINTADVFIRLMELVGDGKLSYRCEFRCPSCSTTLFRDSKTLIPTNAFCDRCDEDLDVQEDDCIPVFSFMPDYIESLKKKFHYQQ
jgi:hypothetical protein